MKTLTADEEILKTLTLKEKVRLLTGAGAWHTYGCNGKVPSIMMTDGPHGLRKQDVEKVGENNRSIRATCFPTQSALACSWNAEAAKMAGMSIGEEALAEKVSIVLGCGNNMKRSPLCGRNFEYFSEDPFLSGKMASAYIKGIQSKGVGACLKHFAGNNQETRRQTCNSEIDERTLREIYLQAFEIAVKESHPCTVMASYNRLNGEYACENKKLLTEILRDEWGFKGAVISDWSAAVDSTACIKAGMDLEMPDNSKVHTFHILDDIKKGIISEEEVDRAVLRVIHLVTSQAEKIRDIPHDYEKHHDISRKLECESAVLLKNDGFLPIKGEKDIIIIGEMAENMRFQGGGSSHVTTGPIVSALSSFKNAGFNVRYAKGYREDRDIPDEELFNEAVKLAEKGGRILFFGGLIETFEGEGYDRTSLRMPENQIRLFERLFEVNKDMAFIAFGGSAMEIPFADKARAILNMYLGGEAVGEACVDLLVGKENPSGKLAETFPLSIEDVPSYKYFGKKSDDVEYRESIFIGYRYYDTFNKPVLYPFGHGLSYTSFEYSDMKIDKKEFDGGSLKVSLKVKNTGECYGREIVEIYVKNPECTYLRPVKELRGFKKVSLNKGEEKEILIELTDRSFSIYDTKRKDFIMVSGDYEILAASSSRDIRLRGYVHVNGIEYIRDDRNELSAYFRRDGKGSFTVPKEQFEKLYGRSLSKFDKVKRGEFTVKNSLEQLSKESLLGKFMAAFAKKAVRDINKGKREDDPEVMMFMKGVMEGTIDSVICQSGGMVPYKAAEAVVLSANGHHLKALKKLLERDEKHE